MAFTGFFKAHFKGQAAYCKYGGYEDCYNVNNYKYQIVNLAQTTLRNIIRTLTLKSANSERVRSMPNFMEHCTPKLQAGESK